MMRMIMALCLLFSCISAYPAGVTLNVKNASLPDTIRFMATSAGFNVLVSPAVSGSISLTLNNVSAESALDSLLVTQGLMKWQIGKIWYIAGQDELIKRKQDEIKWQDVSEQAALLKVLAVKIRYAKAGDVARLLQSKEAALISRRGSVRVDGRTNTLFVQDVENQLPLVKNLIARLDVPVRQIMIEARLTSMDVDAEQELGIHFNTNTGEAVPQQGQYSIALLKLPDATRLDVKLAALEARGALKLISTPRLFTANQQPAYIESGEEVPYQEVSESGGTAVTFKKAVLALNVTPQILPDNKVLLQLKINQDRPAERLVQGVPAIRTRQILTSVLVKNGETVALGGIYEINEENAQQGLPFLDKIPVMGALFRSQTERQHRRELLIFVTPKIMI